MNLHELVSQLIIDTKGNPSGSFFQIDRNSSLGVFVPELIVCATILTLLLVRLFKGGDKVPSFLITVVGTAVALYFAAPWELLRGETLPRMEIFTGMLVYDSFSIYLRSLLLLFAMLFAVFTWLSGIPNSEDGTDVYALVLGATLGMCLMTSANHLLMIFMAVEMASVPSYVLAGLMKGRRLGSEAALKYAVYGAGAAGVMLYGISLLAGLLNSAHLPTMAAELAASYAGMDSSEKMVLALGALLTGVGLAFKLSAVPFHFWCPDVFEGAPAEVGAFLSIASKAAALGLLVRVVLGFGMIPGESLRPGAETPTVTVSSQAAVVYTALQDPPVTAAVESAPSTEHESAAVPAPVTPSTATPPIDRTAQLRPIRQFTSRLVAFIAILTCTFGNLAAYGQTNIKRLLAYSTIAHAGYMMMPVAALLATAGVDTQIAAKSMAALGIYIATYLFMNLGAFAVVAFVRNAIKSEEIADYAGLIKRAPLTVICFSLILFSLVGMPPLAGFVGKFAIFASLAEAYTSASAAGDSAFYLLVMLVVGGLNTALCLFYYLRVVKVMTIDDEAPDRPPFSFSEVSLQGAFLWMVTLPTALLMVSWNWLSELALAAARELLS